MKIRKGHNRIYRFFDPDEWWSPMTLIGMTLSTGAFGPWHFMSGGIGYYMVPDNMVEL